VQSDIWLVASFTHNVEMPAMLPGIAPTGRKVELPPVVVMGLIKGRSPMSISIGTKARCARKLACWIRPNCKVTGSEQARKLLDPE
jgi:carboxymethylenebutenolidase